MALFFVLGFFPSPYGVRNEERTYGAGGALPTRKPRQYNRKTESTLHCKSLVYSRAPGKGGFGEMGGPVGGIFLFPANLRGGAQGLHGDGFYPPDQLGGERLD